MVLIEGDEDNQSIKGFLNIEFARLEKIEAVMVGEDQQNNKQWGLELNKNGHSI